MLLPVLPAPSALPAAPPLAAGALPIPLPPTPPTPLSPSLARLGITRGPGGDLLDEFGHTIEEVD